MTPVDLMTFCWRESTTQFSNYAAAGLLVVGLVFAVVTFVCRER